ncbi:hypothetical protein BDV32DRAFT_142071 [Aspergillus pseudonomiae]|nr:hypothetical protein BDV32DRAFT_142071 [Aspergillus pseudonomiae]
MAKFPTHPTGPHTLLNDWLHRLSIPPPVTNQAVHSRYVEMLLETERIPLLHNLIASVSTWLLLAGYLVFPGTFVTLRESHLVAQMAGKSEAATLMTHAINNPPLLALATISCTLGTVGCGWLWWRWRTNYIWPPQRIFLPALLHSTMGFVNTILNVYTARHGTWSIMAIVSTAVSGSFTVTTSVIYIIIQCYILRRIKREHQSVVEASDYTHSAGGN